VYPKHEGHILVIPKVKPAQFVWDLDPDTYRDVMETCRKVALRLRSVLPYKHVHQSIVGTDVPYAHVHVMPFNESSELHLEHQPNDEPDHQTLAALAEKLYFKD